MSSPSYADRPWLESYPPDTPHDCDFPEVPLTRLLDNAASALPHGVALVFLGNRLTYTELRDQVDRFASALRELGVRKRDRVALVLPNCPQAVIALFAALRIGAVVVQHNPLYTERELAHLERVSGGRLVEGYGMTETSPVTHGNPVHGKRKAGSVGLPLPGTECKIVERDDVAVLVDPGEPGEPCIRGPQVFRGYWNRPDETAATLTSDGWVRTGDIATMDDEGYFQIVDRKKELIIAGGSTSTRARWRSCS